MRLLFLFRYCITVLILAAGFTSVACAATKKKIRVDNVVFDGNRAFSRRRLLGIMLTRPSQFLNPSYYNEEIFQEDRKALELLYHQYGYLDAAISGYTVKIDSSRFRAAVEITVFEGEQTRIEGVSVLGNSVFPDSLLMEYISVRSGQEYHKKNIDDTTMKLLTFYADNGYLDAEVTPDIKINSETHSALIDYYLSEKSQYTISTIQVQGLEKTQSKIVNRELLFKPGDVVDYSKLLESQRNIYLTGLFQSVFIRTLSPAGGDSAKKDIQVDLKENLSGEFNVAVGYGSIDRARGKIEAFNHNVRGTALKLGLVGKMSFVRRGIESSFTNPWTFGTPVRSDLNLMIERKSEPGYDLAQVGGRMTLGRKFRYNNLTVTYRHEQATLSNIKGTDIPDDLKSNARSLKLSLSHDTRDNLFNSIRGLFVEASAEFGAYLTGKTSGFYRFGSTGRYFFPIGQRTVLATSAEVSLVDADGGLGDIPLYDRLYTGGPNSLRGFAYEKVGPLDAKRVPVGGRLKVVINLFEIRRTLYRMVGGAVFIDIGNVWKNPGDFNSRDMRFSPGLGLRVNTPIGLGRLDYGFNIDRQAHEPPGQFYFSLGQAF